MSMAPNIDIQLKRVEINDLLPLIKLGFRGDVDLLETYHISPGTLDHCARHTYDVIIKDYFDGVFAGDVHLYAVVLVENKKETEIGFSVIVTNEPTPHNLLSFAINFRYRKPEILKAWLVAVEKITGLPYFTGVWDRNTRAVNFFLKNGFKIKELYGGKLLIKTGSAVC